MARYKQAFAGNHDTGNRFHKNHRFFRRFTTQLPDMFAIIFADAKNPVGSERLIVD